jgi:hypothetical protein
VITLTAEEELVETIAAQRAVEIRDMAYAIADEVCAYDLEEHATLTSDGWYDTSLITHVLREGLDETVHRITRARRYLYLRQKIEFHTAFPKLVRFIAPVEQPE